MSLPARSRVWSAVEAARDGRVRDLLHADCDVHSVAPWCVRVRAGAPTTPVTPADDLILAAIGPPGRNVGTVDPWPAPISTSLVVGAGPAGVAAGIEARRLGLDALVVDKATFPRDKTCGDGLTTGALRLLDELGFDVRSLPSWVGGHRHRARLPRPAARSRCRSRPTAPYAGVVPRAELDAALVDARARAGRRRARGHGRDRDRRRRRLASSRRSPTAPSDRALRGRGRRPLVAGRVSCSAPSSATPLGSWHAFRQYFTGVDDRRLWVLFEEDLLPGYAWVFPVGRRSRANVGFGVLRTRRRRRRGKALAAQWRSLADRPSLRRALGPDAEPEGTVRAWPIPADYDRDRLTHGRVLFVGDAGNVVDPMTGEGIAQALESGLLAARAVAASPRRRRRRRRALPRRRRPRARRRPPLRGAAAARPARPARRTRRHPRRVAHAVDPAQLRPLDVGGLPPRRSLLTPRPLAPQDVRVRAGGLLPTLDRWPSLTTG